MKRKIDWDEEDESGQEESQALMKKTLVKNLGLTMF